ncbi:MAG: hypothetical protein KCHDKBKB_00605 [Elusimicrobia bacterium]|nr:hypothetical protein [Elusimicrobiota bacterium]
MALNSWQKLTRVLPGQPFGDGADGAYSSATAPSMVFTGISGSSGSTSLTTEGAVYSNGDVLILMQMRGTGVGQWEINRVSSGGGTTSLTLTNALQYTYTDSGASQAQAVKIYRYTSVTQSGTWDPGDWWDENTGGVLIFAAQDTTTFSGTISADIYGFITPSAPGQYQSGKQGEGTGGSPTTSLSANGNGGGGGNTINSTSRGGGAGGGNGEAGANGQNYNSATGGTAGATAGSSDLSSIVLGGAGGQGGEWDGYNSQGGKGGGIIIIYSRIFTQSGSGLITSDGSNGSSGAIGRAGSGGGAGGSVLILANQATIGTDKIGVVNGTGGVGETGYSGAGGNGGKGRIAIYYGTSLTGSISSSLYGSYTNEVDVTLASIAKDSSVKANILVTNITNSNSSKSDILVQNITNNNSTKAELFWLGQEGNSVTASIYAQSLRKYYQYRVYDQNNQFIKSWSNEVTSEPHFRSTINSGPGDMTIRLSRTFDDFGEDEDVKLYNHVEVWCFDREARNGTLIYNGFISGYRPVIEGNKEYVEITLLHDISEMSWIMLRNGAGATTITMNSTDPSDMFKNIINYYRADRPKINYTASSVDTTGTTVSYTFQTYTIREALDKAIDLTPENWYWRIDADNIAHLHLSNLVTPDHDFLIGRHVSNMETWRRGEDIINTVYFVGQESAGVPMYRVYKNTASIATYGIHATKLVDQRVTQTATADLMANRVIDQKLNPEIRTTLTILDSNQNRPNIGYDIESIRPGQSMRIRNIKQGTKTLSRWDIAEWDVDVWDQTLSYAAASVIQIQSIDYSPGKMIIEASSRLPIIAKRVEDIQRNLEDSQTWNTPTTPTAG